MSYLSDIVKEINSAIIPELPSHNINSVGIAQQMVKLDGDKKTLFPCYVDNDGEGVYIGPDDDSEIIIYHRINNISVGKAANLKAFGDTGTYDAHIANVSMVVFGQRDKLKMANDEMAITITANMPDAMEKAWIAKRKFRAANINVSEIILNDMQVFNEEYSNITYFLKPEQFLLKINYKIESAFLKKCFRKCGC